MVTRTDEPDALDILAGMKPDLDAVDRSWPAAQRDAIIDRALSGAGVKLRSRASRWLGAGVAAAAIAAAAFLLVPAALGPGLPAVPAPGSTPGQEWTPPAPDREESATLRFDSYDPSDLTYGSIRARLYSVDGTLGLDVDAARADGTDYLRASYTVDGEGFWSSEVSSGLALALVPGRPESVISLDYLGDRVDSHEFGEFGRTLVAIQTGQADGPLVGLIWQGADGVVHNSFDRVVPSADLDYPAGQGAPAGTVTVFLDERLGVWGYIERMNDDRRALPLSTAPVGSIYNLSATSEGEYYYDNHVIGLLPPGGTDPVLVFTQDGVHQTSAALGGTGQIVFLAVAEGIKQGQPLIESVAYTDAAGKRVSYDPAE